MSRYCRMCDEERGIYIEFNSWWEICKHIWRVHMWGGEPK